MRGAFVASVGWLLLLLPAASAGSPLLVAVVPDLPGAASGDEGFAIGCDVPCDLSGWSVSDGEDSYAFPAGTTRAGPGSLWFSANTTAWTTYGGPAASAFSGPRFANDGDEVYLRDGAGVLVDSFAYGDGSASGMAGSVSSVSPGRMYLRDGQPGAWVDTNRAADWVTPRDHRIGESSLDQPTWMVPRITAYASPDSSFTTLTNLIATATTRLHLHVYELRSIELVDALVAAKTAHPQLELAVSVDASPVGQSLQEKHATADALRRIQAAGGSAVLAAGRYDDYHLKVLVADDAVAVQSENWVSSGVPVDPSTGNRGWGVILHSPDAAQWFATWMAADRASWGTTPFDLATYDPTFEAPGRGAPRTGNYGPIVASQTFDGPFRVRPLVAPDHTQDPRSDPIAALLRTATERIDVQQLDLATGAANSLGWSSADPLLSTLTSVASSGTNIRVQAAAPFSSTDEGNAPALLVLTRNGIATATMERDGIATLHNKGFVVDDTVIVGSMNGNHHSRSENREVDLIIEGAPVADYFHALFDSDWNGATAPVDWSVVEDDIKGLPLPLWPSLFAILAVLLVRRWT